MNAHEISLLLAREVESVVEKLFPNGKREGREWVVGSTDGEPGKSLKVCVAGPKVGVWKDFASDNGGDLLDLWAASRSVSLAEAFNEAREWLGVSVPKFTAPRRSYTRPDRPQATKPGGKVLAYLTQERKLSEETIAAFKVAATKDDDAIVFPFLRDGELINLKHLALVREGGKKRTWQAKDAEPCLFGWQAMSDNRRVVAITEGELDAMSLHQYGIPALSVNQGAGNHQWIDSDYDRLERFSEIAICFDADEPGQKGAKEVAQRLGIERCRLVRFPFKDANECLQNDVAREVILKAFAEGERIEPDELKTPNCYADQVVATMTDPTQEIEGAKLPWPAWRDRVQLRPAELSIITGINGHGKSELWGQVLAYLIRQGERICIFSGEMKPGKVLERLVRQSCAVDQPTPAYVRSALNWMTGAMWLYDRVGSVEQAKLLEAFRYAAKRYRVNHFLIDSLMKCGIAEDDYRAQKAFIDLLCDFKNEFDVHVHLIAHSRKGEDEFRPPGKLDVKGTGAITDLADNVFTVWRNKRKEHNPDKFPADADGGHDALLICNKQRDGGYEGALRLWFDRVSHQFSQSHDWRPRPMFDFEAHANNTTGGRGQ